MTERPALGVVFVGNVDHGKSTLIARLLLDTGAFPQGRYDELAAASRRRGVELEISFLLDALQIERDQAITVDASRLWFASERRRYAVIDAPGHGAFVRNMITGASDAVAAVLVVDAVEGVSAQTRRHAALLAVLGVGEVVLAVNKMDTAHDERPRFGEVAADVRALCGGLDLHLAAAVPTVARDGDGVVRSAGRFAWYDGPTLLEALDAVAEPAARPLGALRVTVQDVYRRDERRIVVGRVAGGVLRRGAQVRLHPSGEAAAVAEIVTFPPRDLDAVEADAPVAFVLDRQVFVQPGDVLAEHDAAPPVVRGFRATTFCLDRAGFGADTTLRLRVGTRDTPVIVEHIESRVDMETMDSAAAETMGENDLGIVVFRTLEPVVVDPAVDRLARFALFRDGAVVGGGVALAEGLVPAIVGRRTSPNVTAVHAGASEHQRQALLGQRGVVLWLTGMPSSGKSTLAARLEGELIARGRAAFVLDGDTLRTGINGDLGFSHEARTENVRRTAEVAALFAGAGLIAICAMVSPYRADRERARAICAERFYEVFVDADLATCERRDVKGLYRRARAGEIPDFTGISAPYERPAEPDLVVHTDSAPVDENVAALVALALRVASVHDARA